VVSTLASLSGLQAAAQLWDRAAAQTANFAAAPTDLAEQVAQFSQAAVQINASVAAVHAQDDAQASLIDVIA
jgi:predicted trehalose synthase